MHMAMGELTAMIMGIHHMIRNNEILILTQMLSPSFPVGSFAYSHGMESAINEGLIVNVKDLEEWLRCLLTHGSGWTDAALLNISILMPERLHHQMNGSKKQTYKEEHFVML